MAASKKSIVLDAVLPSGQYAGITVRNLCDLVYDPWNYLFKLKGPGNAIFRAYGKVLKQQASFTDEYGGGSAAEAEQASPEQVCTTLAVHPSSKQSNFTTLFPRKKTAPGQEAGAEQNR